MLSEVLLWNLCFILLPSSSLYHVAAFEATPRWGQATVVVNDALYVYGGKTDEFNSFSYNSAPNNNDLLYLSLSSPFTASSPPWALVSSSANSTTQGPPLAWSILAAFNTSDVLLFGGQPGPNSQTVIVDAADSAVILDVFSRLSPNWIYELASWAGEPTRRIRHSAATSTSGFVFIFGGEKADGSNNAFSDHYVFNPNPPTFTLLPSDNGPPDLYGHVSIILPNGRIVVFGGYSQSQASLLPFSVIWVLDTTQSPPSWSVINTITTSLPSPRMAFAAVLIVGGKIIIHGGCDANMQTNFADGWVLDTTQNPMTWTEIPALSQLGARRDHFAVASGNQVIFGFGYENSGPAPAPLQIYDPSSSTFVPTYTPPPAASMTQTLPTPSQTNHNSPTGFPSTSGVHPTATNPNNPPGNDGDSNDDGKNSSTTAIAVGTAFGVMGLILVSLGATYYVRRQHRNRVGERQFLALGGMDGDDGDESPHFDGQIPVVGMHELDESPGHGNGHRGFLSSLGIAGALGVGTKMRTVRNSQYQRRDMLADEDTRSFGEWYNSRAKDGRAGSSWSLRSILGGGRLRSRDGSTTSHSAGGFSTPWREKVDPFSDGAAATRDEETGFIGAAAGARPRNRREMSYTSYASSRSGVSYRDPFVDPIEEDLRDGFSPTELYADHSDEGHEFSGPSVRHIAPTQLPAIRTVIPLSQQVGQTLSPLSEHTSQSTLPLQTFSTSGSSQAHSSENVPSPFAGGTTSQATSLTSFSRTPSNPTTPGSPPLKTTSIIGASDPALLSTNQPMRRSDSWWARFSRSSLLDRRSSDASRTRYDIRDPNPAPRLGAIEEASSSSAPGTAKSSPGSGGGKQRQTSVSRANSGRMYGGAAAAGHGKSMTSLRTADSEAIERMAGTMDVVQKERSRWGSGSTSSAGGLSVDTHASVLEDGEKEVVGGEHREDLMFFASPVEEPSVPLPSSPPSAYKATFVPVGPLHLDDPGPSSPGKVSERIQAYERRMSQGETSPPPINTKQREERSKKRVEVDYGLVPRASLYVANPDHRLSSHSADS